MRRSCCSSDDVAGIEIVEGYRHRRFRCCATGFTSRDDLAPALVNGPFQTGRSVCPGARTERSSRASTVSTPLRSAIETAGRGIPDGSVWSNWTCGPYHNPSCRGIPSAPAETICCAWLFTPCRPSRAGIRPGGCRSRLRAGSGDSTPAAHGRSTPALRTHRESVAVRMAADPAALARPVTRSGLPTRRVAIVAGAACRRSFAQRQRRVGPQQNTHGMGEDGVTPALRRGR